MLEFEVDEVDAMIDDFDPKIDKEGAPYTLLTFSAALDANALAFFHSDLRDKVFMRGEADLLEETPLVIRDRHQVYPLKRDEEMGRALMQMRVGIGDPMRFEDCALDNFELTPQDGGRVIVRWRAKCKPTPLQAGRLYELQGKTVELTIEPAELPEMKDAA